MSTTGKRISTSFSSTIVKCFACICIFLTTFGLGCHSSSAQINPDSINTETMTAQEAATELVNPNSPLGRVTVQFQGWLFEGDPTDASRITGYSVTLESSLPFPVSTGAIIRFRPNIPIHFQYPVIELSSQKIENKSGLADITFDLAYGRRNPSGVLFAFGIAATLPTATTDELGNDCFSLGPEMLISINPKWGVLGIFPSHEWKVAGDGLFNTTIIQPLASLLPGRGWGIGSSPNISYDWINKNWSVPWVLNIGKTTKFGSAIWTFSMEINYYGQQHDTAAPEWMIGINVTRVVGNWFLTLL